VRSHHEFTKKAAARSASLPSKPVDPNSGYQNDGDFASCRESIGMRPCPVRLITSFSVKRQGVVSNVRPLCSNAILARQQKGLKRSFGLLPAQFHHA
jgi:hypothetical protein